MQGEEPFDEELFFASIAHGGARALLIGRRALIALGLPVFTSDYDLWLHIDDIERLNASLDPRGFVPSRSPEEARARGRYVLEDTEHVDVLVARVVPTVEGVRVAFDDVWERRQRLEFAPGTEIALPSLDDLILTKRFGARPRDLDDIRLLEVLREGRR